MKKSQQSQKKSILLGRQTNSLLILFCEIIGGIFLSLLSAYFFIHIAYVFLRDELHTFDLSVSQFVYTMRSPFLNDVMYVISLFGADLLLVTALFIIVILLWKHHQKEVFLFFSALAMTGITNVLLKTFFQRTRPDIAPLLDLTSSYSFPSGHAMSSFVFYSLLAYLTFHFTHNKWISVTVAFCSIVMIFLIGMSRIYLGVHYPSDILAGYSAGLWVFVSAMVIDRTIIFFKLFRGSK